eukprot:gene2362-biopygen5689
MHPTGRTSPTCSTACWGTSPGAEADEMAVLRDAHRRNAAGRHALPRLDDGGAAGVVHRALHGREVGGKVRVVRVRGPAAGHAELDGGRRPAAAERAHRALLDQLLLLVRQVLVRHRDVHRLVAAVAEQLRHLPPVPVRLRAAVLLGHPHPRHAADGAGADPAQPLDGDVLLLRPRRPGRGGGGQPADADAAGLRRGGGDADAGEDPANDTDGRRPPSG